MTRFTSLWLCVPFCVSMCIDWCFSHMCNMYSDPLRLFKSMPSHLAQTRSHALSSKTSLFISLEREETARVFEHACARLTLLLQCCCCCCCFCHGCCCCKYSTCGRCRLWTSFRSCKYRSQQDQQYWSSSQKRTLANEAPRLQFSTPQPQRTSQVLLEAPQNSIAGQPQQGYS